MERTALTNEIFSYGKNIFRGLHNRYGFDFEAPHTIFRVDGCFTVSAVRKLAYEKGAAHGAMMVALCGGGVYVKLHAVRLFSENCDFEVAGHDRMEIEDGFYNMAHKSEFIEARRCVKAVTYVVFQNKEYVKHSVPPHRYIKGWDERYRLVDPRRGWWWSDTQSSSTVIDEGGKRITGLGTYGFDKSGYCVSNRRNELIDRADSLRAERKKAEINYADVVAKALAIDAALAARKAELVNMLLSAVTDSDFAKVGKAIGVDTWRTGCYANAVSNAKQFKSYMERDAFKSVSDVDYYYNNVMESLK